MQDLFRHEGGEVKWVHEACSKKAVETWLRKKWSKQKEQEGKDAQDGGQ